MANNTVIGLGGYGVNFINHFSKEKTDGFSLMASDSNTQHLSSLQYGEKISSGMQTKELADKLSSFDNIFILFGLGGNYGSKKASELAKELSMRNVPFHILATKPFFWEGKNQLKQAEKTEKQLRKVTNSVTTFGNDELREYLKNHNKNFNVSDAFAVVDDHFKDLILNQSKSKELI